MLCGRGVLPVGGLLQLVVVGCPGCENGGCALWTVVPQAVALRGRDPPGDPPGDTGKAWAVLLPQQPVMRAAAGSVGWYSAAGGVEL
jgi:hypothetical protein